MNNPKLKIYQMLKEKNLLKRGYSEYEAMIKEEETWMKQTESTLRNRVWLLMYAQYVVN